MKKSKLTAICIGCTLLILIPTSVSYSSNIELTKEITPAGVEFIELVPDPNLSESPTVIVNGTSEEFDSLYHHGGAGESNHVNLTWAHTANTTLDFAYPYFQYEDPPVDCRDFIYFAQTFEWNYEYVPRKSYASVDFAVTIDGSFATEESGQLMFKIYMWLIDSSGNWRRIYRSFPPYVESYQTHRAFLSYFDMDEGWSGMVEDENGFQEDPEDKLTIAVGLAPTSSFLEFMDEEPWKTYDGSVVATIRQLNLITIVDEPPFQEQSESKFNGTLPTVPDAMALDSNDSVYIVGHEGGYDEGGYNLTLSKMDAHANLLWTRNYLDGFRSTRGYGISISPDNYIYTVGTDHTHGNDLILIKWDADGNFVWNRTWGLPQEEMPRYREEGLGILVSENGSIYTIGNLRIEYIGPDTGYNESIHSFIVKWDSDGNPLWNLTSPEYYVVPDQVRLTMFEGRVLTTSAWGGLLLWSSSEVEILTDIYATGLSISSNNQIYSVGPNIWNITLSQWDSEGESIWNKTWGYSATPTDAFSDAIYPAVEVPDYHPIVEAKDLDKSKENMIFVSGGSHYRGPGFLIKFDDNGNQLWNISYGEAWDGRYTGMGRDIEIGSNGLIYVLNWVEPGTLVLVFEDPDIIPGDDFVLLVIIVTVIGAFSLVAIVVIIQRRKG